MFTATVALLFGVGTLVVGADRAVEGVTALAGRYGVSTFFVGLTVVAVGSSLPEIATSVYGALYGAGDLVVGHVVGSATSQITLGVGVVALAGPLAVSRRKTLTYGGGMLAAMAVMAFAVTTGHVVSHVEGVVLVCVYAVFLGTLYEHEDYDELADPPDATPRRAVLWAVVGLALVVVGGHLLVTSGRSLAADAGVPTYLVGVVTGLGTTLPEIAVALLAVRRDRDGIAVGTLLGSNITDPLFSLGVGAAAGTVPVSGSVVAPLAYMAVASAVVVAVLAREGAVTRWGALFCLVLYLPTLLL